MVVGSVHIGEIATERNASVSWDSSIRKAISVMHGNGMGVAVVLKDQKPIGIITERDAVRLLFAGTDMEEAVMRHATRTLINANGARTIGYALGLMVENGVRRLVVTDDQENFLGVVTQSDLLGQMEDDFYRSTFRIKHILDHMKALVSASKHDSIVEVLRLMVENRISAIPIVEEDRAIGIITEKDILRLAHEKKPLQERASRYMSSPVFCAGIETLLTEVVKMLHEKNIRRIIVVDGDGRAKGIVTNRDLARNLEGDYNEFLERKLRYSKDILNLLPEMLFELIDTGDHALVVWANEKALSMFGETILDKPATDLVPGKKWETVYKMLLKEGKVEDLRFKKGNSVYELSGFYMSLEKANEKGRIELILRDITEEVMLASTDPLTELYNRRYMNEFLVKETERNKRTSRAFTVVLVDIDDSKKINDTYGHFSGDIVLKEIVRIIKKGTREYDVIGRYGGEEFLIIMPEIDKEAAMNVVERLRQSIEDNRVNLISADSIAVTASFGIASFQEDGVSPDDLLVLADERLYRAKQQGKNLSISS